MAPGDPVLDALLDLARARFPTAFAPEPERGFMMGNPWIPGLGLDVRSHPAHEAFEESLASDPKLKAFAPPNEPFISSTAGRGWRVEAGLLASTLISTATALHVVRDNPTDDLDGFLAEVREVLDTFRRLLGGESADMTTVIGFDGLTLREGRRLESPWGTLRAANDLERTMRAWGLAPSAILTLQTPVRFRLQAPGSVQDFDQDHKAILDAVNRSTLFLPLAALLGVERDDYLIPGAVWFTSIVPAQRGTWFGGINVPSIRARLATHFVNPLPREGGAPLTEAEEARLLEGCNVVEERYDDAIGIAVRRTVRALLERAEAEDALIDAVMAMENLFGHGGTTEVAFRVTTALALLLEPDPAKRSALRSELAKIYDLRSTVVHGGEVTPRMNLAERKERAIETAVQALRVLFAERPHLIPDRDRGMRLLLSTADP